MAGKPKDMSIVKQLLLLHQSGKGKKTIARDLGISKNTVTDYLDKVESTGFNINKLLKLDNTILEAKLFAGNPAYKDKRYENLKSYFEVYKEDLQRVGVTKMLLWEEYKEVHSDGYSRSQFNFHLAQSFKAQNPSMVLEHVPADKLFIDFAGKKLSYIDRETGEAISCQVFVACLPYSDYSFAMAVHSQSIPDFLHALESCLYQLGGVPKTLVPDNLKSAIIKADNYEPQVNKALADFAIHYSTTVTPTRARKPKDKALVENQVKMIYSRVYAKIRNQQFFSLNTLNQAISGHILAHNQTRMQKKDYCREERFLANEKKQLKELPDTFFELKYYKTLKVAQNNHVYLSKDKRHYSVPYHHIGAKATVIYTHTLVNIYVNGEKIASHVRVHTPGYSTLKTHLCSQHQHYLNRSPDYYLNRAKDSDALFVYLTHLFAQTDKYPEHLYKICDGIFSVQKKTPDNIFKKAVEKATLYEQYSYQFLKNIIINKTYEAEETSQETLPEHENMRGAAYYN
jgi:transposase